MNIYEERCIALSAMFQVAKLVDQLANGVQDISQDTFSSLIHSLFIISPRTTLDIYQNLNHLEIGCNSLTSFLTKKNKDKKDQLITRYVINLLLLQKKLKKNNPYQLKIGDILKRINQEKSNHAYLEPWIFTDLSNLYVNTISKLGMQIRIIGLKQNLQQRTIVSKIRSLLLAGIRAAFLWEQKGGKTHQLFIFRHNLTKANKKLHTKIINPSSISN